MQRRDFLLAGAALAAGPFTGEFAGTALTDSPQKRLQVRVVPTDNGNVAQVAGPPNQVRAFVEDYQTQLWPDWRTHKNDLARKQLQRLKPQHEKGFALVAANKGRHYEALLQAAAKHAVPIGVVA